MTVHFLRSGPFRHSTRPVDGDEQEGLLAREARDLIAQAVDHYTARNGRRCSIEGDDGEKCWIIPFDALESLRSALAKQPSPDLPSRPLEVGEGEVTRWLLELRATIHPLTQQGEDRIWRAAEKGCALIDKIEAALAVSPAGQRGE